VACGGAGDTLVSGPSVEECLCEEQRSSVYVGEWIVARRRAETLLRQGSGRESGGAEHVQLRYCGRVAATAAKVDSVGWHEA
jgi:hypothetical protein